MREIEPKVRTSNLPLSHILSVLKALHPLGMVDARLFPGALSKPAIPTLPLAYALSLLTVTVQHCMVCFIQLTGRYLLLFSWVPKLLVLEAISYPMLLGTCFLVMPEAKQHLLRNP